MLCSSANTAATKRIFSSMGQISRHGILHLLPWHLIRYPCCRSVPINSLPLRWGGSWKELETQTEVLSKGVDRVLVARWRGARRFARLLALGIDIGEGAQGPRAKMQPRTQYVKGPEGHV